MNFGGLGLISEASTARFWRFGDCEFDELSRQLMVNGKAVFLEPKPLDVLLYLLMNAGEVVTKEELMEAVWPDLSVVDSSLTTAISQLRKAVGEEERSIIVTVPRVGYRLAVPVHCRMFAGPVTMNSGLKAGTSVPQREQWLLSRSLGMGGAGEVWLASNPKTNEERVFKFASDGARLKSLKREITVYRYLHESLGERSDFVRLLEWNLETSPYFIECEYVGPNLMEWAAEHNRLAQMNLDERLKLLTSIVQTVADAHSLGVLHKDLKPANILVVPRPEGGWQTKIADFGSASLFDPSRLQSLGITNLGFTKSSPEPAAGTQMYIAPEVLAGNSSSAASDVYSLGVILYQALVGDFKRPLAPGWEDEIPDSMLREDIAAAANGDAGKRIASATELAERLRNIERRRSMRSEVDAARSRMMDAERNLARARSRRPWIAGMIFALVAGLAVSFVQYLRVAKERDIANQQTAIADAINAFLSDDLIGRSDPFASSQSEETLIGAIRQALPNIDSEFQGQPLIAAHLHQTLARAFDNRTDYTAAREQYFRAAELYRQVEGELSQDGIIVQLQRVAMEARSNEAGSLPMAKSLMNAQQPLIARLDHPRPEIEVWNASAKGMIALIDNDPKSASMLFARAEASAAGLSQFDELARLNLKQRLAFCFIRMGDGEKAEQLFKELIVDYSRIAGAESANVLRARLSLAQAYMIGKKHQQAIDEVNAIYPEFVTRLGADHELTMQLLTTRAQSEGSLGRWNDAIRDDMAIHAAAAKKQGSLSFFAIATLSDVAMAQCRAGHLREGSSNAHAAYDASSKAFGPKAGLTGDTADTLASCLADMNQLDDASFLLSKVDVPAVAQLNGDPNFGAEVKLVQAEIAQRRGEAKKLHALLDEIRPVFTRADAEEYERRKFEELTKAPPLVAPVAKVVQSQAVIAPPAETNP